MIPRNLTRRQVNEAVHRSGVIVVLNQKHVRNPKDLVTTMWEIYQAGYIAECTFRIDTGILKEGMAQLVKKRDQSPADNPFVLGVGSVINPVELESAMAMGFDLIVAPANVMSGHGEGKDFVRLCRQADVFCAPAVFTPTELQYFIERSDGLEPDAVKIFPAGTHGPEGIGALLAPFTRPRHAGRIILPTGGVDEITGPKYQTAISAQGFTPVLGMSAPLREVEKQSRPGDIQVIQRSLAEFQQKFRPSCIPK
ncbi:MAG: hypothetical protein WC975_12595 [Phycisphaerae bacterium]